MKRFILFAFVFALGCNGTNCPVGKRKSNGVCCDNDSYYNKVAKRCEPCHCDSIGAKGWTCNSQAQCDCYNDYTGLQCKQCKQDKRKSHGHCCLEDHYFDLKTRLCTPCHCDSIGARRPGSCDSQGQCDCYDDYTGLQCNQCKEGQKMSRGHCCLKDHRYIIGDCHYCDCDKYGAIGGKKGECDKYGKCNCHAHYSQRRDSRCRLCDYNAKRSNGHCCLKDHYYSKQDNKCIPCNCHEVGAKGGKKGHCDGKGQCSCISTHYKGPRCQNCPSDFRRTNDHCCKKDQYYATWSNECRDCSCDENGAIGGTGGACDDKGNCYCKPGFTGSECSTCSTTKEKCCKNNQYLDPGNRKCYNCNCHASAKGGTNGGCSSSGQCHCRRRRFGKKCDKP